MLARFKASIAVDLKSPAGVALVKHLAKDVDVLIDPFRPGVLERLGLGPDVLLPLNSRLIYARMSGFRRDGRYATMAGHDINYLAVSGVLSLLGRHGHPPRPPWNILADFAGGGAVLFQGILLALASSSRRAGGQVVEANMVDGSSYLASYPRMALKTPLGAYPRGENMLDGGCPWYDVYETSDPGGYMAVGALEPQFYRALVEGLGLRDKGGNWEEEKEEARRQDRDQWPEIRRQFVAAFKSKTRAEWERIFDGTDACCTPVLTYDELETDPEREGRQRPVVTLSETPCLAVEQDVEPQNHARDGQGPGVPGRGYAPSCLAPGEGGEDMLRDWLGWEPGRDYEVRNGGLILRSGGESNKL